jgi:hypothetical protein
MCALAGGLHRARFAPLMIEIVACGKNPNEFERS